MGGVVYAVGQEQRIKSWFLVDRRPSRIAGVKRHVGLDDAVDQPPRRATQATAERADNAGRYGRLERAPAEFLRPALGEELATNKGMRRRSEGDCQMRVMHEAACPRSRPIPCCPA